MADEAKEPAKSNDSPGLLTMFAVAVVGGLTVHFIGKYLDGRRQPSYAALPPPTDPWDFEG